MSGPVPYPSAAAADACGFSAACDLDISAVDIDGPAFFIFSTIAVIAADACIVDGARPHPFGNDEF
jgi:hypothetical protein